VGGCQTGEAGSFSRTKRDVFGSTKIHLFGGRNLNVGITHMSFGARCLNVGARYLNFGARYLNFGAKLKIESISNGVWGVDGSPKTSGGFVISVGKKISANPLLTAKLTAGGIRNGK